MANAHDVAAAVLTRTGTITTMKLQKLVYYSQAWHLVFHNVPMFEERIEAWPQGPVTPSLYAQHRKQYEVADWPRGHEGRLDSPELETLTWVLDKYAGFSAESLSRMTHMEIPWKTARGILGDNEKSSAQISLAQLRHFYSRQRTDPDVAVAQAAASSAIEGVDLDDEWQRKLRDVASGTLTADELVAEEIRRARLQ
ncbi:Panacea domain-containing protein [Amycolatopsis sp. H20-H5]|uniref:Panacea domain-containing protein n=1 Tax=Amycolatopsis sp. H20-H5 TaxID=3046309 RepID=UPI002DB8C65C|nr:type II toxin-antitoxin system antitoxin SocA domain-containing protein [Amycolatopsis sp. H20-H5]MEC3981767.1 type II toxin-antitoxin system antitoxin SocA domain-containing protein [Amycolatopsis sp. H20-H5]